MTTATEQKDPGVILAACGSTAAWLLQGEDHLADLLSGTAGYPLPVVRWQFDDADAFAGFLQDRGLAIAELWSIHPNVIARLETADEIRDETAPLQGAEG